MFIASISEPLLAVHSILDRIRDNLLLPKHSTQLRRLVFELLLESLLSEISPSSVQPGECLLQLGVRLKGRLFWEVLERTCPPKQNQVLPLTARVPFAASQRQELAEGSSRISSARHRVDTRERTNDSVAAP